MVAVLVAVFSLLPASAQSPAEQCDGSVTLVEIAADPAVRGLNKVKLVMESDRTREIKLEIAAEPKFFFGTAYGVHLITMPAGKSRWEMGYSLRNVTERTTLRVGGFDTCGKPFFERTLPIGGPGAEITFDLDRFNRIESKHFELFTLPQTYPAEHAQQILSEREDAVDKIEKLIGTTLKQRRSLFFYPDAETKRQDTGHQGAGWQVNETIVEIYSPTQKLDPYHELTHLVAANLGDPPAIFNEGLAIHVADRFTGNALAEFKMPGVSADDAVRRNIDKGNYVPLPMLFTFQEIGSDETKPLVSYPEAGSFVGWLAKTFGEAKLRTAYSKLINGGNGSQNLRIFREVFRLDLEHAEHRWRAAIGRPLSPAAGA